MNKTGDSAGNRVDVGNPDLGKTAEELALEREIAELAAQGREEERGAAADRLAALISEKMFGKRQQPSSARGMTDTST